MKPKTTLTSSKTNQSEEIRTSSPQDSKITARIKKEEDGMWLLIDRDDEESCAWPIQEDELDAIVEVIKNYIDSSLKEKQS